MKGITDRGRDVLDAIRAHIRENGYPPTLREIGEAVGIGSTNGVYEHLERLEEAGAIERERGKARSIRVIV